METRCCIAGGGPAGMMLGLLLARAGIEVVILEKHADFFRDFRGDTVHPSTLEVMHELGLLDEFLKRPHQEIRELAGRIGSYEIKIADLSHLPTRCRFIALMPQWDFLDFIVAEGRRYKGFHLLMSAEATGLVEEGGRVAGLRATTPDGEIEIRAALTVGADGRHSTVRDAAGLVLDELGAPIDALWMRLPRRPDDPQQIQARFDTGRLLVMIDRGDYWQCAYVIPKGGFEVIRQRGLAEFQRQIAAIEPMLRDRVGELDDWEKVKLLTVAVNRLRRWHRPGLLCIGDAAHAMSPLGGVGINLAVQDAVAAANILAEPLAAGSVDDAALEAVQRRRTLPTRVTQRLQVIVQDRVISRVLASTAPLEPPLVARLLNRFPALRRIPARLVGLGIRPEHVRTGIVSPAP